MLTARQFAAKENVAYTTVHFWLRNNLLIGVAKQDLPSGGFMYLIPENTPRPEFGPGPERKAGKARKAAGKARKK